MGEIESMLKSYVLNKYGSILAFTKKANIPYSTFVGVLTRGIHNSNISSILKICDNLNISSDDLYEGRIIPKRYTKHSFKYRSNDVSTLFKEFKTQLSNLEYLSLDGVPIRNQELDTIFNVVDIHLELIKRKYE